MTFSPTRAAGLARLDQFIPKAGHQYAETRNYDDGPDRGNVSQLSPWLRIGLLSEQEVIASVLQAHSPDAAEKFIAEVFWRVYFKGYLEQRPTIWSAYCQQRDSALQELDSNAGLAKAYTEATEGRTGITTFDYWAKELAETGYLHNHARMWFASIWVFTLKLDWSLGADFFIRHLIDGDAASNTLSWRWVAGLHTLGKTYLARADNIHRYTQHHPDGPFAADGLAQKAVSLVENNPHSRQALELPPSPDPLAFKQPYALLIHDDAASHETLDLPHPPALVIGASRPSKRSPLRIGEQAREFAEQAVDHAVGNAAKAFDCPAFCWRDGETLGNILDEADIDTIVMPFLPVGWTHDALWPELLAFSNTGKLTQLVSELDRQTFPHARAGFFRVKKEIPVILGALGLAAS